MLRRLLIATSGLIALAGSAVAADMPLKAAPLPAPVPVFSWTGFYIGAQVGWAGAHDDASIVNPGVPVAINLPFTVDMNGVIGGGHIGYNLQFGHWVWGIEGTVDGADLNKTFTVGICPLFCGTATTDLGLQGSIRGRLGYAFDRLLVYGTGGAAIADITNTYDTTAFGGGFASIEQTRVGWTAGAGLEYALDNNWSVRTEYRFSDFGKVVDTSTVAFFPATNLNRHVTQNQVQFGASYRFDASRY
jgi:outer membrane immunogenic protein